MVGVLIEDDIIRIPHPVIHIGKLPGSNAPIPVVEPEAARIAPFQSPAVLRTKSALEAAMLPGMVFVKAPVVPTLVVTYPNSTVIHVRRIGMTGLIAVIALALVLVPAVLIMTVLVMTCLIWPALIVTALFWTDLSGIALVYPVLVWSGLLRSCVLWMPLLGAGSAVIGFRPALRRRSGRVAASWVAMVFVLVFLRKCRG